MEEEWFLKMLGAVHAAGIDAIIQGRGCAGFDSEVFMSVLTAAGYDVVPHTAHKESGR